MKNNYKDAITTLDSRTYESLLQQYKVSEFNIIDNSILLYTTILQASRAVKFDCNLIIIISINVNDEDDRRPRQHHYRC